MNFEESNSSYSAYFEEQRVKKSEEVQKKSGREKLENQKSGRWNLKEQILYLEFIDTNKNLLEKAQFRRYSKIFKLMSSFVKTRGADQCRSHHQKKQKKFKTLANIILNCKESLNQMTQTAQNVLKNSQLIKESFKEVQENMVRAPTLDLEKGQKQGCFFGIFHRKESTQWALEQSEQQPLNLMKEQCQQINLFQETFQDPYKTLF